MLKIFLIACLLLTGCGNNNEGKRVKVKLLNIEGVFVKETIGGGNYIISYFDKDKKMFFIEQFPKWAVEFIN